ncbi:hypothetical protein M3Y94_00844600 [Aphelenchoides besseyi]|nr:hypothetical protein M3Y94_00844600 [Aphelenchoides besseyi]KAI6226889.1 hypothetical protein M3Y95_00668900 [Aphelenchoides besseyi]
MECKRGGMFDLADFLFYRHLSRRFGRRKLNEMIRWVVVILIVLYLLKIYWDNRPTYIIDHDFANVVPGPSSASVLAKECSNYTKVCYGVMDYAEDEVGLRVRRVLYVKGFEKEVDTMISLIPPVGRSFKDSDTRFWQINHTDLGTQYVAVLSVLPFVLGSVPALSNTDGSANLFVLGLGGGSLDMFFHTLRPQWQIDVYELDPLVASFAHKWFGVVDDEKRKTHIQDGLIALDNAVKQNKKFDVLIIDACDSDPIRPCPSSNFLELQHLQNMKSILNPTGCLLLNVLVLDEERRDEMVSSIEQQLLSQFSTCFTLKMSLEDNAIIACLPFALEPSTAEATKIMYKDQLNNILKKFAFNFDDQLHQQLT